MTPETTDLRYVEADQVRCPAGTLAEFKVCTEDAQALGSVTGVLISPQHRRCEFFVIESTGLFSRQQFLLPVDTGAVVRSDPKTLQIAARREELDLSAFTPHSVPEFSDDDLIRTMFRQDAA